jgi:predicted Rossmann fold nucleotide-binding protein DprA/Smf involved in DNA uptake
MTISLLDSTSPHLRRAAHIPTEPDSGIESYGNRELLEMPLLAVFCSIECPGDLILQTYDLARLLANISCCAVIGGFQSPIEQEFLIALLRGTTPAIVCPARTLHVTSLEPYRQAIDQGRLLLVSPFASHERRMTRQTCQRRNTFVAALADRVFVSYASPGGMVERMCRDVLAQHKPVFTFDSQCNRTIMDAGAIGISCDDAGLARLVDGIDGNWISVPSGPR